jgi:hypothetical protein
VNLVSSRVQVSDRYEELNEYFRSRRWTDGLPIVPPTEERVAAMLAAVDLDPAASLGKVAPSWEEAVLEKVAVNAVMAGCAPAFMPVVVAAIQAMCDPKFNLYSVQATTHPVAPLVIVNGPIARRLGMNSGSGVFGPGFHANATIGRAIRLVLLNIGGGWPGEGDMATQGQPSKYSYCIAENEAANPWEPLHVERGFARNDSVVTVFGGESPHNVNDHVSTTAAGVLGVIADTLTSLGGNTKWYFAESECAVVLGPEHAATIHRDGLTKADVRRMLYETARRSLRDLKRGGMWQMHDWPRWMQAVSDDEARLPIVPGPEAILLLVAGGPGKHSAVIPNMAVGLAVSRQVAAP